LYCVDKAGLGLACVVKPFVNANGFLFYNLFAGIFVM